MAQEIGSRFSNRIWGTCIKHNLGKASIKMYDKFGRALRLETTANNEVSFSKHFLKLDQRKRHEPSKVAPLKKTINSLVDLR